MTAPTLPVLHGLTAPHLMAAQHHRADSYVGASTQVGATGCTTGRRSGVAGAGKPHALASAGKTPAPLRWRGGAPNFRRVGLLAAAGTTSRRDEGLAACTRPVAALVGDGTQTAAGGLNRAPADGSTPEAPHAGRPARGGTPAGTAARKPHVSRQRTDPRAVGTPGGDSRPRRALRTYAVLIVALYVLAGLAAIAGGANSLTL